MGIPLDLEFQTSLAHAYDRLLSDLKHQSGFQLLQQNECIRKVDPASWHITLAFSGGFPCSQLATLQQTLQIECEGYGRDTVKLCFLQQFPDAKSNIIAALIDHSDWLGSLRDHVNACFHAIGAEIAEHERFRPHITLARLASGCSVSFSPKPVSLALEISRVILYQSELGALGPHYKPLIEVNL